MGNNTSFTCRAQLEVRPLQHPSQVFLAVSFVPWSESVGAVSFFVGGEREIDWKKNKANARMNSNVPPTPRAARTPVQPRTFRHPIVVFAFVLGIDLLVVRGEVAEKWRQSCSRQLCDDSYACGQRKSHIRVHPLARHTVVSYAINNTAQIQFRLLAECCDCEVKERVGRLVVASAGESDEREADRSPRLDSTVLTGLVLMIHAALDFVPTDRTCGV
eukprot:scaffold530_cov193-Alexandrium_tamarense.AAC.33